MDALAFSCGGLVGKAKKKLESDAPLVPLSEFQEVLKGVLSQSKEESDAQLERLQASNAKRRTGLKRGRKPQTSS